MDHPRENKGSNRSSKEIKIEQFRDMQDMIVGSDAKAQHRYDVDVDFWQLHNLRNGLQRGQLAGLDRKPARHAHHATQNRKKAHR